MLIGQALHIISTFKIFCYTTNLYELYICHSSNFKAFMLTIAFRSFLQAFIPVTEFIIVAFSLLCAWFVEKLLCYLKLIIRSLNARKSISLRVRYLIVLEHVKHIWNKWRTIFTWYIRQIEPSPVWL